MEHKTSEETRYFPVRFIIIKTYNKNFKEKGKQLLKTILNFNHKKEYGKTFQSNQFLLKINRLINNSENFTPK